MPQHADQNALAETGVKLTMSIPDQGSVPETGHRRPAGEGGAARRFRAMAAVVDGELLPGETIEITTVAELGSIKPVVGTSAAGVAAGVAMAAATGIGVGVVAHRRRYGVMLTNRRLLFIEANQGTGRFLRLAGSLPRDQLGRSAVGKRLYLFYDIVERGTGRRLYKLSFPLPNRRAALQIAAALPEVDAAPSSGKSGSHQGFP